MSVMSLFAGKNCLSLLQSPGYPKRFQVGHGAAAGKMAQMLGPTEHCGDFRNGFLFHGRSSATAIERVIVRD